VTPPRILIVGGGYVGMYTALGLERRLAPAEAELTLVSPENYMRYQPLLPEVASGSVEPRHMVIALRRALRRTQVVQGELTGLDHGGRTATVSTADDEPRQLPYDQIVLGMGSMTKVLPVPGLVEHAVGFQTLSEAIHLRNQVLARLEAAEASTDPDRRRRALTFVFVGGGYAGVEALAELEDLARDAIGSYRSISAAEMRWMLIEATDRILPSMDAKLAERASAVLRARGVEIRLQTQLESTQDGVLELDDGERIAADTLVWMPGIAPHPVVGELGLPCDAQGRLIADRCLRVRDAVGAWTAGDTAAVPDGEDGLYPPTAQHAEREAHHLAVNIVRTLRGERPLPFDYEARGEFVTLGHRKAVARILSVHLHGPLAWALRRAYYLARIPSTERRLRLALDWTVGLAFKRDIAQLGSEQHPDQPLRSASGQL
jgi:NADH dehydrogenase